MANLNQSDSSKRFITKLQENLQLSIAAKQEFLGDTAQLQQFSNAVQLITKCYQNGGRLYIAGNGGSAADSQHLAAEFVSKLARPRAPLPAEALTVDTSILTAIGNDYGFEEVFARQIAGKMGPKDVFLGITTSGTSRNIVRALEQCKKQNIPTIVLCGRDGGVVKDMADYCLIAKGEYTSVIQEVHTVLYHSICACVEEAIFG
ncbi:MAG: SIS domain-containing protein [Deltaproteobacteria bacterium]|nr:SIS domain-containing protein [Deltaproteobacteria bacterium]